MEEQIKQITTITSEMLLEMNKQLEGNKAAGLRARKHTNTLTKLLKEFRQLSVNYTK